MRPGNGTMNWWEKRGVLLWTRGGRQVGERGCPIVGERGCPIVGANIQGKKCPSCNFNPMSELFSYLILYEPFH